MELLNCLGESGFGTAIKETNNRIIVYTTEADRVLVLKSIAAKFDGVYSTLKYGTGWKSSKGSTRIGNTTILAKPSIKNGLTSSVSTLDVRVFSSFGVSNTLIYSNTTIDVIQFDDYKQIEHSIIEGCEKNELLGNTVSNSFKNFFISNTFIWDSSTPQVLINKIGIYAGELLIGWVMLKRKEKAYLDSNPFIGKSKRFLLPADVRFSGVDSFIDRDKIYALSSKFGVGAKASFFTNLLKHGIDRSMEMEDSVFRDICLICRENNIDYRRSRDIVYRYGNMDILASSGNQSLQQIAERIVGSDSKIKGIDEIKRQLPNSVTAFFCRTISQRLNECQESIRQSLDILTFKDFYQINLDINKWYKNQLLFSVIQSKNSTIKFYGNKSPIGDITAKQGFLNYAIT